MYCIKKVYVVLILFVLQPVSFISAQEVIFENGYPVINLSTLIPSGATLSYPEAIARLAEMNAQTEVTNTAYVVPGGLAASGENGTWNTCMSVKYQVMQENLDSSLDWAAAWNACKTYSGEGGSAGTWRLPTQRELQMIWILYPQLIGKGGFVAFLTKHYWSSTEHSTIDNAWYVRFAFGYASGSVKTTTYSVRCVRDLP